MSNLDAILTESADEIRGYLRERLQDIALVAAKALEALDAGEIPLAQAGRLFRDAKDAERDVDRLLMYAELAEKWKEAQ